MTVNASTGLGGPYNGNGVQVAFTFGFKIYAESDLEVIQTDAAGVETVKTLTTHYTVSAGPWPTGGTVTMLVAPPTGQTLTIRQNIPNTQSLDYTEGSKFPANSHEDGLDRLTLMVQAIVRDQLRALVVPKSESVAAGDMTLPTKATRASKFLAFDSNGRLIAAAGTSADLTPVSAYINTLLDDANAAAAQTTLGLSSFFQTLVAASNEVALRQLLLLDKKGADIASASTLNLDTATGDIIDVTGTTAINAITLSEGVEKRVRFTGTPLITNGASLVCLGGVNKQVRAGDFAVFRGYAAGVVRMIDYSSVADAPAVARIVKYKLTDQTITLSTTLTNDSHLTFPIGANEEWLAEFILDAGPGLSSLHGLKLSVTVPAGVTQLSAKAQSSNGTGIRITTSGSAMDFGLANFTNPEATVVVTAFIRNGSTAGDVTLQFAQSVSHATGVVLRSGSRMYAYRIS